MKRVAPAVLALKVITIMPVPGAQTVIPVKKALFVVSPQDDPVLQSILAAGDSYSSLLKMLKTAEESLSPITFCTSRLNRCGR